MAFVFVSQVLTREVDKYTDFIILAHMTTIENYMKSFPLSKTDVKSFDLFSRSEGREGYVTPFEATFPTLDYFFRTDYLFDEEYSNYKIFMKRLKTEEVEERFRSISICWNRIYLNIMSYINFNIRLFISFYQKLLSTPIINEKGS